MKNDKKVYIEWIRIIAISLVIFNHVPGFTLYFNSGGIKQWIYMFLSAATKINVPLFFMISGALLLQKEEHITDVLKKRVSRFALILPLFSAGMIALRKIDAMISGTEFSYSLSDFLRELTAGRISGLSSYWYLYAYLGFLCMLPFLQRIAQKLNKQDFIVLVFLRFFILTFFPMLNLILKMLSIEGVSFSQHFSVPFVSVSACLHTLIGYYIEHSVDVQKLKKKEIAALLSIATIAAIITCVFTWCEAKINGRFSQNYIGLFSYLLAIISYIMIKRIVLVSVPTLSRGKAKEIACFVGPLTFGMYLLDPFLKQTAIYKKYDAFAEKYLPTLIVSIGWCIISMTLCGAITYLLKKVKPFRKIL